MRIREITGYLEEQFPLSYQEDYDNCGLITGDQESEVIGVLISLDVTEILLEEAIHLGCNLVIAHHPLIFTGIKKLTGEDAVQKMIITAIKNNIGIYALHTNLDNAAAGLNHFVADKLGIVNTRVLSPRSGMLSKLVTFCPVDYAENVRKAIFEAGAGHIGHYDCCSYNITGEGTFRASEGANPFVGNINELHVEKEIRIEVIFLNPLQNRILQALTAAHPYEEVAYDIYPLENAFSGAGAGLIGELKKEKELMEFLAEVKSVLSIPVLRHTYPTMDKIKKVALCTGSGSFLISDARKAGADLFLTADLKYHDFFGVAPMILSDIGHFESEQFAKDLIHAILIKKFPNFAFLVSKTITNPVNYF